MRPSPEGGAPSIFLIGYRGSGKSSAGRALAQALGRPFHDTDVMAEAAAGKGIARVFAEDGEPAFRALERAAIDELARRARAGERFVAATGGGIVLSGRNVDALRASGLVVWLTASARVLEARITSDPATAATRPALHGRSSAAEVEAVLGEREPLYRAAAHVEVSSEDAAVDAIVGRILSVIAAAGVVLERTAGAPPRPGR
jgi:shikimate kinase